MAFPILYLGTFNFNNINTKAHHQHKVGNSGEMGNYRFKFSDMIPNAWFYKLKDLTKHPTRNHTKKKHHQNTSVSNHTHVTSPALTSPSTSSIRDKHHHHHHHPSSSFSSQNHHSQSQYHQRKSYYFTRDINKSTSSPIHDNTKLQAENFYEDAANGGVVQLPRRSSKKRQSTRRSRASPRLANSSVVRTGYSCRSSIESLRSTNSNNNNLQADSVPQDYPNSAADTSSETEPKSNLTGVTSTETIESTVYSSYSWSSSRLEDDIVIDLKSKPPPPPNSARHFDKHIDDNNWQYTDFDSVTKIDLPPVKTKSKEIQPITTARKQRHTPRSEEEPQSMKNEKSNQNSKRFSISSHSPGVKLRTNTPRIVTRSRKSVSSSSNWRKSLSDSFAVVTSSKDPERDFRESMVEMIVEHNISSSKELEDLLACYLSLNSYKHHDVIINVFKQIWFEFVHT